MNQMGGSPVTGNKCTGDAFEGITSDQVTEALKGFVYQPSDEHLFQRQLYMNTSSHWPYPTSTSDWTNEKIKANSGVFEELFRVAELGREMKKKPGYHLDKIPKGVLGEVSKIQEEVAELADAHKQGIKLMAMVELADLYGAMEAYAQNLGITMEDVKAMAEVTKRAFENGRR
jgi:NTP pyrophosphatase (non-canonical NTP hydrolase)